MVAINEGRRTPALRYRGYLESRQDVPGGCGRIFQRIKTLQAFGVNVISFQEQWLQGMAGMTELFVSMLGWVAWFESDRRSQRTKAGIAQKRLHGGGKRGKDRVKRKTRIIKRPTVFTSDAYAWPDNL